MPDFLVWPGLILLGVAVGSYGTIIGAGGGFVLTPTLLLLYPDMAPEIVTAISLGVVFVNALSGTGAYARQRRIDYRAALIFASATVPGAMFGASLVALFPRRDFEAAFGVLLILVAVWLIVPRGVAIVTTAPPRRYLRRQMTDYHGETYVYSFDPYLGAVIGLGIGFISSLFGVGGGIIYVPVMVMLMRFPLYIATATSTFTLMFTAGAGALVHVAEGRYAEVVGEEVSLAIGVLVGAQVGALVSTRLQTHQAVVLRLLSAALLLVGARLLFGALL